MSDTTYYRALQWLIDNQWVLVKRRGLGKSNVYNVMQDISVSTETVDSDSTGSVDSDSTHTVDSLLYTNTTRKHHAANAATGSSEIDAIIDYLNTKAGRHYRHTEPNRKGIRARIAEGYTSADCRRVIDTKVAEWQGTDMEKHLNCETLFRPSKFDKYLNQAKPSTDDKYERLDNGVMVYKGLI